MTKEQKICDILAREYPEVYADIEKQVGEVKREEVEMWIARDWADKLGLSEDDNMFDEYGLLDEYKVAKLWDYLFPYLTYYDTPKRVKLILED